MLGAVRLIPVMFAALSLTVAATATAKTGVRSKVVGRYRVELEVLEGGARPTLADALSHPNHHFILHIFDRKTGEAITDATVVLHLQRLNDRGSAVAAVMKIPVVVMQAIGQEPASTHYGNNERLSHRFYRVTAPVKGVTVRFHFEE